VVALIIAALTPGSFVSALIGCGAGLATMFVIAVIARGEWGGEDVKMAAMMGAMVYFPQILVALMLGIIAAGSLAIILVALETQEQKKRAYPSDRSCLWNDGHPALGQEIIDWYLGLVR